MAQLRPTRQSLSRYSNQYIFPSKLVGFSLYSVPKRFRAIPYYLKYKVVISTKQSGPVRLALRSMRRSRAIAQQGPKCTLRQSPSDSKDWFTIKCLIALLDPIAATSELLGGQGYPTLALAFPCLRQIERTLNRYGLFDEEALLVENAPYKQTVLDLMTTVHLAFVGLFERRFADLPTDLLWISYLDPRLTNMEGLTNDQCTEAITGLIDAAIAMAKQENLNQSQSPQSDKESIVSQGSSIPKKQRTTALEGVFGKRVRREAQVGADARVRRLEMRCNAEVYRYLDEVADTEFDVDPPEWWRLHGQSYPYLAPLARQWLACVATSVPSERAFSSAGNIINCKRTKLDPSLVRDLLFIHDNFEFPEWETDAEATTNPIHEKANQSK
ncbi:unnamed protein product [Phytophthora fragariaefolia]|uniref:Unnamed protein product n=1 Tax=Phytophthora fragariaefolia TaxID=1490495 RepID=A0A9W7CVA0_9STRA|nr:unnamed protein product [Phytophthora fragariaefolia]